MKRYLLALIAASLYAQTRPNLSNSSGSQVMTSTCQANPNNPCSGSATVTATSADAFVDSEGTLFDPTSAQYGFYKLDTLQAGFRHIRSANTNSTYVTNIKDMAASGIKTQLVISTNAGMYSVDPSLFYSPQGQTTSLVQWLKATFPAPISNVIDVIEGPNELNIEYGNTFWHPADQAANQGLGTQNTSPNWLGAYGVAYAKATWTAVKADSALNGIKILGPAPGYYNTTPYVTGANGVGQDLQGYVDWGGCHPYATAGNGNGLSPTTYDGSTYYLGYTISPAEEVDFNPTAWNECNSSTNDGNGTLYGNTIPLAPSEQGYPTCTINGQTPEDIQARYYPRIYTEMWRHGMPRSITYRFDDGGTDDTSCEGRFGLVRPDMTYKPSFFAMRSLNNLLKEPGASFTPGTLTYSVAVTANGAFTRTQYMHDLLLEKSNGDFYLLFWHEIADVAKKNNDGSDVVGQGTLLNPLSLPVTFTLPASIANATLYTYDANYNLAPAALAITSNQVSVNATDKVSVIRLSAKALPAATQFSGVHASGTYSIH